MRYLLITFLLSSSFGSYSQNNNNEVINIRISCGFAGISSNEVNTVQELSKSLNYSQLKQKLYSSNKLEALLAAISLRELQIKKMLALTVTELSRINKIEKWKDKYTICFTCTQQFDGTVKNLLSSRKKPEYRLISETLFESD